MGLSLVTNALSSISSVATSVGSLATTLSGNSWYESLRTASFGGVPFAVEDVRTSAGRRTSVHSYPFRDTVWVEDMGKGPRQFSVSGFLVENSEIYGGGGAVAQRKALLDAAEKAGGQTLVHPTLGTINNVTLVGPIEFGERVDLGRVFEFRMTLVQGGLRVYPTSTAATQDGSKSAARDAFDSALSDFKKAIEPVIAFAGEVQQAVSVATRWVAIANSALSDVKSIFSAVAALPGNYGRYTRGQTSGYAGSNAQASSTATVSSLLADAVANRTSTEQAGEALITAAAAVSSDSASFATAIEAVLTDLVSSTTDPGDALRVLIPLAQFEDDAPTTDSALGLAIEAMQAAVSAVLRRICLCQIARVCTEIQPASSDDARSTSDKVAGLIDAEILTAGDEGDDETYAALRALRAAVVSDLSSRAVNLPAMRTFSTQAPLPSLVLAKRLYQDAGRADQLVDQADPIHPAFMPTQFRALAT